MLELPKNPQDDVVWEHLTPKERDRYEVLFREVTEAKAAFVKFQKLVDARARMAAIDARKEAIDKSDKGIAAALVDALAGECESGGSGKTLHSLLCSPERAVGLIRDLDLWVGVGPWAGRKVKEVRLGVSTDGSRAPDRLRSPSSIGELQTLWSATGPLGFTGKGMKARSNEMAEEEYLDDDDPGEGEESSTGASANPACAKTAGTLMSGKRGLYGYNPKPELRTVSLYAPVLQMEGDKAWRPFLPSGLGLEKVSNVNESQGVEEYGLVGASTETTMFWDEAMKTGKALEKEMAELVAEDIMLYRKAINTSRGLYSEAFASAEKRYNAAVKEFQKIREAGNSRVEDENAAELTHLQGVTLLDLLNSNPGDGLRFSDLVMRVGSGVVKTIRCFALLSPDPKETENSDLLWSFTQRDVGPLPRTGPLTPVVLETLDEAREMLSLGRLMGEVVLQTDLRKRTDYSDWGSAQASGLINQRSGVVVTLSYDNIPDRSKVTAPSKIKVIAIRNIQPVRPQ